MTKKNRTLREKNLTEKIAPRAKKIEGKKSHSVRKQFEGKNRTPREKHLKEKISPCAKKSLPGRKMKFTSLLNLNIWEGNRQNQIFFCKNNRFVCLSIPLLQKKLHN
jgi:hypothetical protein